MQNERKQRPGLSDLTVADEADIKTPQVNRLRKAIVDHEIEAGDEAEKVVSILLNKMAILDAPSFIGELSKRIGQTPTIRIAEFAGGFSFDKQFKEQLGPSRVYSLDDENLAENLTRDFQYAVGKLGKNYYVRGIAGGCQSTLGVCIQLPLMEDGVCIGCYITFADERMTSVWSMGGGSEPPITDVCIMRCITRGAKNNAYKVQESNIFLMNFKSLDPNKKEGKSLLPFRKGKSKEKNRMLLRQTREKFARRFIDTLSYDTRQALIKQLDQTS